MGLDEVADELYGLDPDAFMAARTAAVAQAKTAGDPVTAKSIGALRRPTRAAWAVNLLSRYAGDQLTELMELGDALAAAQESLSGPELRRLSTQRNQVVQAVARQAAGLAAELGAPVTEPVRAEVVSTLQAALADPDVRELVVHGRLDKARAYSGFGLGLATGAVAAPTTGATSSRPPAKPKPKKGQTPEEAEAAAQAELLAAVERAEAAVTAAEQAVTATAERLAGADAAVTASTERVDQASQEVADLRAELRTAEAAETEARRSATEAADAQHDAKTAQQQAMAALTEAQRALRDLVS